MKKYNLANGHTLEVEKVNRGYGEEYFVIYKEDGITLFPGEYYSEEAIGDEFGVIS